MCTKSISYNDHWLCLDADIYALFAYCSILELDNLIQGMTMAYRKREIGPFRIEYIYPALVAKLIGKTQSNHISQNITFCRKAKC